MSRPNTEVTHHMDRGAMRARQLQGLQHRCVVIDLGGVKLFTGDARDLRRLRALCNRGLSHLQGCDRSEASDKTAAEVPVVEPVVGAMKSKGGGQLSILRLQIGNALLKVAHRLRMPPLKIRLFLLQRRNARLRRRAGLAVTHPDPCADDAK